MKTFSEAFLESKFWDLGPMLTESIESEMEKLDPLFKARAECNFPSSFAEAYASPEAKELLEVYKFMNLSGYLEVTRIIKHAFAFGVVVGIKMEKEELSDDTLTPKP